MNRPARLLISVFFLAAGVCRADSEAVIPLFETAAEQARAGIQARTSCDLQTGIFIPITASSDPLASPNLARHPCKPPQEDLYAASCTCPNPQKALQGIVDANKTATDHAAKAIANARAALAKDAAVIREKNARIHDLCARCQERGGLSDANVLRDCFDLDDEGAAGVRDMQSHVGAIAGYRPSSEESFGSYSSVISPALTQGQCEAVGRGQCQPGEPRCAASKQALLTNARFAGSLVEDYRREVLRSPGDARPVGSGIKAVVVDTEAYDAVAREMKGAVRAIYPPSEVTRLESAVFNPLKEQALAWIKARLQAQHEADCPPGRLCLDEGGYDVAVRRAEKLFKEMSFVPNDDTEAASDVNGAYSAGRNAVTFTAPMLRFAAKDPAAVRFLFLHELGHATQRFLDKISYSSAQNPLYACLRDPHSVGAAAAPKDQLGESFADWFATEEMSTALPGPKAADFIAMGRTLCGGGAAESDREGASDDEHPTSPARLNRILAAQPAVRAAFGAPATEDPRHCPAPASWGVSFNSLAKEGVE